MDRTLRRLTAIILLALALLAWFEESLFGTDRGVLRLTVGVLCIYVLLLVLERQRLEDKFMQLLTTLKNIKVDATAAADDVAKSLDAFFEVLNGREPFFLLYCCCSFLIDNVFQIWYS